MSVQTSPRATYLPETELPTTAWRLPIGSPRLDVVQAEVCLLLGSNIQPERNLPLAISLLGEKLSLQAVSGAWETPAVGTGGPNFLNAAVLARTSLDPESLKTKVLRPLEARLGRVRTVDKYASRTIDVDLVAWNALPLDEDLWRYAYAAVPVSELLPSTWSAARRETLAQAAQRLRRQTPIHLRPEVALL